MHIRQTDRQKSDYNKVVCLSVCLVYIFICERLWKCCLSPISRLSPQRIPSEWNVFIFLLIEIRFCLSECYALLSVCLSCIHFHLWETLKMLPIAYRLSPQHIPSEWDVFIFLFDWNAFCCLSVCLSVCYAFLLVRDFENVAYRLSPIASTYTKWVEYAACTHSVSSAVMGTYLLSFVIKGDSEIYLLNDKLHLCP